MSARSRAPPSWPPWSRTSRRRACKAVFSESQFSPELAQTLAQEAGVSSIVTTLYNDTVGPPPTDTYLAMMAVERRRDRAVAADDGRTRLPAATGLACAIVTAGYGDRVALTDVDLEIPTGSLLAVIGPNGSGKSTLLKTISGVLAPFAGSVEVFGGPASVGQADRLRAPGRARRLVVPGDRRRRRDDGSGSADRHRSIAGSRRPKAVAEALETVRMADERDRQIGALSGGQRRRVFLAKALAAGPTSTCSTSR